MLFLIYNKGAERRKKTMKILDYLWQKIMTLLEKVIKLANYNAQLKQELADKDVLLSQALANDVADAETIRLATESAALAQSEAQAAKDSVAPLQAAFDADADEDEQITAILDAVVYPEV